MRELRIEIEAETDAALDEMAASGHTSKDDLIRRLIEDGVRTRAMPDPLDAVVGSVDAEPVHSSTPKRAGRDPLDDLAGRYDEEPGDIDDVIYGR